VFGAQSQIVLYGFGGLAIGSLNVRGPWRRIAVLLAGPGAGFLLFALVVLIERTVGLALLTSLEGGQFRDLVVIAFAFLFFMNLVWNLVNLLPIWPLDGGQVCAELLTRVMGERGLKLALVFSIVVAFFPQIIPVDLPLLGQSRQPFIGIMFLLIAAENVQVLMQLNQDRRDWE
jgi:Zn-dependent protease